MTDNNNKNIRNYIMHSENYINNENMKNNDIHYEFTNFIINTALYHKKLDNSIECTEFFKLLRIKLKDKFNLIFNKESNNIIIENIDLINIKEEFPKKKTNLLQEILLNIILYFIYLLNKNSINYNYINILNSNNIVEDLFNNKNDLIQIENKISIITIQIMELINNLFEENDNKYIYIKLDKRKRQKIKKKISNIFFNFIKSKVYNVINLLKENKYYKNIHITLKLKNIINELILSDKNLINIEESNDELINLVIDIIKRKIKKNNYYENINSNKYSETFYENIFIKNENLNFEERFFFDKYITIINNEYYNKNLNNKNNKILNFRINLNKCKIGNINNYFTDSIPLLNKNDLGIWYTSYDNKLLYIEKKEINENFFKELYQEIYFYKNKDDEIYEININNITLKIDNTIKKKKLLNIDLNNIIKKNLLIINNTDYRSDFILNDENNNEIVKNNNIFDLLFNSNIDKLIDYEFKNNEFKLENIHPVIAYRLLNNLGFRIISDYKDTFIENIDTWNENIKEKNNLQELILLNNNLSDYINFVIDYVNNHKNIFKNKYIKNNIIFLKEIRKYKQEKILKNNNKNKIFDDKNLLLILKDNIYTNIHILSDKIKNNSSSLDSSSINNFYNTNLSFENMINYNSNNIYNYRFFKEKINGKFKKMITLSIRIPLDLKSNITKIIKILRNDEKELLIIYNLIHEYFLLIDLFSNYNNELLSKDKLNELLIRQNNILMNYYKNQILVIEQIEKLENIINSNKNKIRL